MQTTEKSETECNSGMTLLCDLSAARGITFIHRGLPERLLPQGWGNVSLHIGKHPLQQDTQSLLERSAAQDVHGRTERHPDVGLLLVSVSISSFPLTCLWDVGFCMKTEANERPELD